MPNGKPGDHALTDIVVHRRSVYGPQIDDQIRELDGRLSSGDREALANLLLTEFNDLFKPDLAKLQIALRQLGSRAP